ncbi:TniQ family protein [Defluviimonas salinarum]|uniref:TniQ family protein n=1 Tax=Defluviimonas salinarum TaxID=2992147 RepID=A0ABT3JA45_9RHOB|nr:TniQ family protein [Defluviimonas salinarum]MCW3784330.1 TniQ family protein [Defluviimonas salinarum]
MATLFPLIPFIADETPLSWAARQAAFHTGGRLVPFLNDLQISAADLARGLPDAVMRLCDKAGQDPEPVLRNTITAIGDRRFRLRDLEFAAEFTTGAWTRICPSCLADDQAGQRYPDAASRHRLAWRLAPVRTCSVHGVLLRDLRTRKWDDGLHELQAMRALIEAEIMVPSVSPPRPPSPLQIYVEARLEGNRGPEWLDGQDIDQATRAAEMLGGLIAFGPGRKAADMTQDMWDQAGQAAWPLISEGSRAMADFLRGALSKNVTREGRPGARKAFGMLYSWLSASRLSKDPGPIRVILRDVIAQNVPLVTGRKLLGEPVVRPRLSSVRSIARTEGIHPKTLRNVLRAAGLLPHQDEGDAVERIIVDYDRARGLIDAAKHAVPASQVPDILNASRPLVAALIELEILTRIHDHDGLKSKVGKAIDGRSIQKVQTFLKDKIPSVAEAPEGLACLSNSAERARARLKVILELLFAGHLHRVVRLAGQTGFGAILVDPEEIKRVLESPPPGLSEEVYYAFA